MTLRSLSLPYLFLDAGNTVVFLDTAAVANVVRESGHPIEASALSRVEGEAKRRYEAFLARGESHEDGWGLYLRTLMTAAGIDAAVAAAMVPKLRAAHDEFNLWRRVPDELPGALSRWRAAGGHVSIISNSEGMLPQLFARVGLAAHFEHIVDSHLEGVRKPDRALFDLALERAAVSADQSVYLGDLPDVDVRGAHNAGMSAVLIDPYDFYPAHDASPRMASVAEWIDRTLAQP